MDPLWFPGAARWLSLMLLLLCSMAEMTEKALSQMRDKRRRLVLAGDQYAEADGEQDELVDEE